MANPDMTDPAEVMKILRVGEKARQERRGMQDIISAVIKAVGDAMKTAKGPLARIIQQSGVEMQRECVRSLANAVILRCVDELSDILEREDVNKEDFNDSIDFYIHREIEILINYLTDAESQNDLQPFVQNLQLRSDLERRLLRLYEEQELQPHFAALLRSGEYTITALQAAHIPEALDFYREYLINSSSLVEIMMGENSSDAFLHGPEEEQKGPHMSEGPKMRMLLPRTAELMKHKSLRRRREKETMHGVIVRTKLGKNCRPRYSHGSSFESQERPRLSGRKHGDDRPWLLRRENYLFAIRIP